MRTLADKGKTVFHLKRLRASATLIVSVTADGQGVIRNRIAALPFDNFLR